MPAFRRSRLRAFAISTTALIAVGFLAGTTPALADTAPPAGAPATVSSDALPTVQIDANGIVWTQTIVGNTVFAAGRFTKARPAGSPAGSNEVTRSNILSFDIRTGALLPFAPSVNGQINSVTASPDGTRLYIGGTFTRVNGQTRNRVAAFSLPAGTLVGDFAPSFNNTVYSVRATNSAVYVGGNFTAVGATARTRAAAVASSAGAVQPFAPVAAGGSVRGIAVSPDGAKVVLAGSFTTLNGSSDPGYGIGAVTASTGSPQPWPMNSTVRNGGNDAAIWSIESDATGVYGVGYTYNVNGVKMGNLEGAFRADWNGNLVWVEGCRGDSYGIALTAEVVYVASHAHDCGMAGSFPQVDPWQYQRAMAWTKAPSAATNTRGDFTGVVRPNALSWWPLFDTGSVSGSNQASWSVVANQTYAVFGGEFREVNGNPQQGLVRFAVKSAAPNKDGPRLSGDRFVPTIAEVSAGVQLTWTTNFDRDNQFLTYTVERDGVAIYRETKGSQSWFDRPTMTFTDSNVSAGAHKYRLRVVDPLGNTQAGSSVSYSVSKAYGTGGTGGGLPPVDPPPPVNPPPADTIGADAFERTVSDGWGVATAGGTWTVAGSPTSAFSVNGAGRITAATAGRTYEAYLSGASTTASNAVAKVALSMANNQSVYASVIARRVGNADYRARAVITSTGGVQLQVQRTGTNLATLNLAGVKLAPRQSLVIRVQATGTSPTTVRAKAWLAGTAEPAAWHLSVTDSTAALQAAGRSGLGAYFSGSLTTLPLTIAFDDFALTTAR